MVIPYTPSADNSNLSADGEDSFISVDMESAMPSPFSEVSERRAAHASHFFLLHLFFRKQLALESQGRPFEEKLVQRCTGQIRKHCC